MLSVIYAECHYINIIILSVVMLSVMVPLSLPFQAYPIKLLSLLNFTHCSIS
jgi:hypothetical protein